MRNETKVVLCFLTISALLGFTQVPIQNAEGAVSWNGFLKQVGFAGTQVYEVSDTVIIEAADTDSPSMAASCLDGDWMFVGAGEVDTSVDVVVNPSVEIAGFAADLIRENKPFTKTTGIEDAIVQLQTTPNANVEATATILCFSPSSMMTVGGEWQPTDNVALIIGYSVLNAYWLAPIGIGIGVGIYLVKRRF